MKLKGRSGDLSFKKQQLEKTVEIELVPHRVIILHPSLGTPLVRPAEVSPRQPLSLFILADRDFYATFRNDPGRLNDQGGAWIKHQINHFLKIEKWDAARGKNKDPRQADAPLFASRESARQHLTCTFLGHLVGDGWKIWDKDHGLFARIHPHVRDHYLRQEIIYGFQIDITGGLTLGEGLYDASWVIFDEKEKSLGRKFLEVQDRQTTDFLQVKGKILYPYRFDGSQGEIDFASFDERPIQSHHPICLTDKPHLDLGHFTDVHLSSRQHAFQKSGAQMLPGVQEEISPKLGSLVNTSFATLKDLLDQFGKDQKVDLLAFTGDLIDYGRNFNPACKPITKTGDIWEAMLVDHYSNPDIYPVGIDNVIVYTLFMYWYDTYKKPILLVSGNHEAYTLPYGISPRVVTKKTLWDNARNKVANPGVDQLIADNTAARSKEWEERKKSGSDKKATRANEGIPADHNLTITEAILLYGPDYNRVTMTGGSKGPYMNFKPANFDWFHIVFTPFSDYLFQFKEQCFIGLGWGDNEKFSGTGLDGHVEEPDYGGFLPRATECLDGRQKTLLLQALRKAAPCTILLSHFTVANYASAKPSGTEGEIEFNGFRSTWGEADHGTFEENRSEIYWALARGQIGLALSGHSHRSGLYQPGSIREKIGLHSLPIKSRLPQAPSPGNPLRPYQAVESSKAKIVVSASGGPIPKQNYRGELFSWGLERPSGTLVRFNGSGAQVSLVEAKTRQAQPRFAVAWDYADIIGQEKHGGGVIRTFESDATGMTFILQLNPDLKLPDVDLIAGIDLFHYTSVPPRKLPLTVSYLGQQRYRAEWCKSAGFSDPDDLKDYLEDKLTNTTDPLFLSCCFQTTLGTHPGFQQYDFSSPWHVYVEVTQKSSIIKEQYMKQIKQQSAFDHTGIGTALLVKEMSEETKAARGVVIRRHGSFGEVPNFEWRLQKFTREFAFSQPKKS